MNRRSCVLAVAGMAGLSLLTACSDDPSPAPSLVSTPVQASTQTVLGLARASSEVADPFVVNAAMFQFNDTSETTDPVSINR